MDCQQPGYVYVHSRGWFHPIKDFETIKWAFEYIKRYSKSFRTRCINEFLDRNEDALEKMEAYELLQYMRSQIAENQRDKRKQSQILTQAKQQLFEAEMKQRYVKMQKRDAFLAKMRGDICLN